jgi:hypothetical protein
VVIADYTKGRRTRPERAQISHYKSRVPGFFLSAMGPQDGNRRFWRNSLYLAPDVAIEDHFTGNHNSERLGVGQVQDLPESGFSAPALVLFVRGHRA